MVDEDLAFIEEVDVPLEAVQSLDQNVISALPDGTKNAEINAHGKSSWTRTARLDTTLNGLNKAYFLKTTFGDRGKAMLLHEFTSMSMLYDTMPDLVPRPIALGTYASDPGVHFLLSEFRNMSDELPDVEQFTASVARFHRLGTQPERLFGFDILTYHGNVPVKHGWWKTWEEYFANTTRALLRQELAAQGPSKELDDLVEPFFTKVIPRLLRPLESSKEKIVSTLIHGDLWHANCGVDLDTGCPVIFDAACFYAHNEYELGVWRTEWNNIGRSYIEAYLRHNPSSWPEHDFDDRNALYAIRVNMQDSIPVKGYLLYRQRMISEMRRLVKKFPGGFEDWEREHLAHSGL